MEQINNNPTKEYNDIQINTILKYLLHACDLSHTTKNFEITEKMAKKINQEYINQHKKEIELNIPETEHFKNLDNPKNFYESEIQFIQGVVKPLFKEVQILLKCKENNFEFIPEQIEKNLNLYKQKLDYYSSTN